MYACVFLSGNYNVHSKPVYFLNELEDVVYFRGSTIELHCYASCEQGCISRNKIYHNGSPELGFHESYDNNTMLTIKINNASVEDSGFYQCLRPVWPWTKRPYIAQIAGRKIHVQITGGLCAMNLTTCAWYIVYV